MEGGDRLLPRGPDALEAGRAGARLPARTAGSPTRRSRSTSWAGRPRAGTSSSASSPSKRQVSAGELLEVGLASPRQRGGGVYDRFRERVIFPIRDANGHAVGLGGRILGKEGDGEDGGPRPEVPQLARDAAVRQEPDAVPHRPRQVARSARRGQAVIVEGYTDALMAHQAGLRERRRQPRHRADAAAGRAASPAYAKRIALAYDVDAAGEKAGTFGATALEELIRQLAAATTPGWSWTTCASCGCPTGKDPDEVAARRARPLARGRPRPRGRSSTT